MRQYVIWGVEALVIASPWVVGLWHRRQRKEIEDRLLIIEAVLALSDEELAERFEDDLD
jgi:hypothetical protein